MPGNRYITMYSNKQDEDDDSKSNFSLRSGTDLFVSRSKDVFASLGALEDKHSAFLKSKVLSLDQAEIMKADPEDDDELEKQAKERERSNRPRHRLSETKNSDFVSRNHSRSLERSDIGNGEDSCVEKDNIFRRPYRPQRKGCQPIPDFKKHPEKYTCYSLADISEKDMSEKSNTMTALAFLEERKQQSQKEINSLRLLEEDPKFDVGNAACSQGKITFSKPKLIKNHSNSNQLVNTNSCDATTLKVSSETTDEDVDSESGNVNRESETEQVASTFKSRKNVRRHIRAKEDGEESE
ncbi:unnamed protein product [Lymnaea stagnalis]|uniref:U5 small nuclear ribonucleoprotein TSSC4 n=1 Tax=Lymnaea stagnalis TaxID=6523 RepID=A0AAV2IDE3_LYMST